MDSHQRWLPIVCGWLRVEACSLPIAVGSLQVVFSLPRSLVVRHCPVFVRVRHAPFATVVIQRGNVLEHARATPGPMVARRDGVHPLEALAELRSGILCA